MDNLPDIISGLPAWLQITLAICALFAIIWIPLPKLLYLIVRWPVFKLWPGREGWSADCPKDNLECLDPNIAWRDGPNTRWSQMRKQRKDDHYSLHIKKPRLISKIEAKTEDTRYPLKYRLEILRDDNSKWEDIGEYEGPINITLKEKTKLVKLKFTITEPHPLSGWCIYDICLTEVRLFGKFWEKVIGR